MNEGSVFPVCAVDTAIGLIGSKWSLNILRDLCSGKKRTSELMKSLPGISPRTLSDRLRELEETGLISRTSFAEIPPRVEYALTVKGLVVKPLINALADFGSKFQQRAEENKLECNHCGQAAETGCNATTAIFEDAESDLSGNTTAI